MTIGRIEAAIPARQTILLDSSVLVAYLDGRERTSAVATHVLDALVRTGRNEGLISTVTLGEILVRPVRDDRGRRVFDILLTFPNLVIRSVDPLVAAESARLRASRAMRGPDALILATGVMRSANMVVTNDRSMAATARDVVPEMAVVLLSDLAV